MTSTISFKASGKTREQALVETLQRAPVPIGIKTPLRPGTTEGVLAMHFNLADAAHDNLRNLILTNFGERLGLYDFGANLRPLTAEFVSQENFDSAAVERIRSAVLKWMPYIELEDYTAAIDKENSGGSISAFVLTITYNIPALQVKRRSLQVTLKVI